MEERNLMNAYYDWLLSLIHAGEEPFRDYSLLLGQLYSIEFRWSIPLDENRAFGGKNLRKRFFEDVCDENGYVEFLYFERPCSVLEMMIGLAVDAQEKFMSDDSEEDRTYKWFWDMVFNMDLAMCYDYQYSREYVDQVVRICMDRKYKKSGSGGGMFRTTSRKIDMRKVDYWFQMCYWLNENYIYLEV